MEEVKEFTFHLMLLGTPGIACFFLLKKLVGKVGDDAVEVFLSIFLLSIFCYLTADICCIALRAMPWVPWHRDFSGFVLTQSIFTDSPKIVGSIIFKTTAVAPVVAAVLSRIYHRKYWNRVCQRLRMSNRYGDDDVFNYLLDAGSDAERWYTVRDHKENLIYYGAITLWSDIREDREIILTQVDVYSNRADGLAPYLYSCGSIYICRNRDDLSIELDPHRNPDIVPNHEREELREFGADPGGQAEG